MFKQLRVMGLAALAAAALGLGFAGTASARELPPVNGVGGGGGGGAPITAPSGSNGSASAAESFLCMAGMVESGQVSGGCAASVAEYFALRVYDESGYDAPATALLRQAYLLKCTSCEGSEIQAIQAVYGMVFDAG